MDSIQRVWAMCQHGDDDDGMDDDFQEEMRMYEEEQELHFRYIMKQVFIQIRARNQTN